MPKPPAGYTAEELERDNPYNQWMYEDQPKETQMIAFLIDPFAQTVNPVEYDGNYKSIYGFIDAHAFDLARFNNKGDAVFVDDEGLINGQEQKFFSVRGYHSPLAGKGLVLGCDLSTGDSCAPSVSLEWMRENVVFVMPVSINGEIVFIPMGQHREAA
jgi:hypothetical protein